MQKCIKSKQNFAPFYIFFALIIKLVFNVSVPVVWTSNSYFRTGRFSYIPTNTSQNFVQYVFYAYPTPLTAPATKFVVLGLIDFNFDLTHTSISFILKQQHGIQTGFNFSVSAINSTYFIGVTRINYITVDPAFTQPFSVTYFFVTQNTSYQFQGPFNIYYYVNFTQSTGVVLDLTHDNAMLAFLHMMEFLDVANNTCIGLHLEFILHNESFYKVEISTQCAMKVKTFGFSRIIFDKTAIENLGYCYFDYGEIISLNGNISSLSINFNVYLSTNFMFGLKSFHLQNYSALQFITSQGSTTTISTNTIYKEFVFSYWSFKFRSCPAGFPYFEVSTSLCYDVCPGYTFLNNSINLCHPCHYTCLTCSSTNVCTNCNASANRFLNGSSCSPYPGYFDNGIMEAVTCTIIAPLCSYCIDSVDCLRCEDGYYVNLSGIIVPVYSCEPCYYTCETCSNSYFCDTCNSSSNRFLNGTQCSPIPGYYDNLVIIAEPCISPCATCLSVTICTTCIDKYYLEANDTCQPCNIIIYCETCSLIGTILKCQHCAFPYVPNKSGADCVPYSQNSQPSLQNFILGIYIAAALVFLWSLLTTKLVGLQLIGVFQLAFLILADHREINSYLRPISHWRYVNGYNLDHLKSFENVPQHIKGIHYSFSFLENMNVMLAIFLLEILISIVLSIFSCVRETLKSISQRMIREVFITFFLFNSFNISFSVGLHFRYATPDNSVFYELSTIAAVVALVLCGFAILSLALFSKSFYGEYKYNFKNSFIPKIYINITIVYRLVLGFGMSYFNDYEYVTLCLLILSIFFIVYNFVNLPFKEVYHNYRANVCHITHFVIILVANYYNVMKSNLIAPIKNTIISPAQIQISMLTLCIIVSVISLIYSAHRSYHRNKLNTIPCRITPTQQKTLKNLQNQSIQSTLNQSGGLYSHTN